MQYEARKWTAWKFETLRHTNRSLPHGSPFVMLQDKCSGVSGAVSRYFHDAPSIIDLPMSVYFDLDDCGSYYKTVTSGERP